ncbi:MAG: TetR/AcrR family transcriptional regulator, partial [Thermomicrobiales bacterium]
GRGADVQRERSLRGRHRAGRRDRPHLSREQVVRAALVIVDRDGLDGFSMRKLGAALGVDPMAAYYYFPNKAAVLDGIVDAVQSEIPPLPNDGASWDVRLRGMFRAYRQVLRAHPHALPVLSTHPPFSIASLQRAEAAAAILHDAGFAPREAFQIINCIAGYVIGVTLAEVGVQPGGVADPTEEEVTAQIAHLPPDEFPLLTAVFGNGFPFDDDDAKFEDGLDLIITGLTLRQTALTRHAEEAPPAHPTAAP